MWRTLELILKPILRQRDPGLEIAMEEHDLEIIELPYNSPGPEPWTVIRYMGANVPYEVLFSAVDYETCETWARGFISGRFPNRSEE